MNLSSEHSRKCKHCGTDHPLTSEFWYRLNASPECKAYALARRKANYDPEKMAAYNKSYREKHRDDLNERNRQWREENKERHLENARKWYSKNRARARANNEAWKLRNPDRQLPQEYFTTYARERRRNDPCFRLASYLRARLNAALKGHVRGGSAVRDLGCSVQDLKQHLESQFTTDMTWENHGQVWEVDHILPLGNYDLTDRGTLRRLVHYTNLQPLLKQTNRSKSNKED